MFTGASNFNIIGSTFSAISNTYINEGTNKKSDIPGGTSGAKI